MTAKVDAKKRAKPRAKKPTSAERGPNTEAGEDTEAVDTDGEPSDAGENDDPEALAADPEGFEAEAELVDESENERDPDEEVTTDADSESVDEEREPGGSKDTGLARFDALQAYMREVQRHPLLSSDEEHKLAVQYQKDQNVDTAARLVTANLRLVVKIAYEYRRAYRNMMDLVQEGNIGLMQAVKRYDPYRGV